MLPLPGNVNVIITSHFFFGGKKNEFLVFVAVVEVIHNQGISDSSLISLHILPRGVHHLHLGLGVHRVGYEGRPRVYLKN